MTLLQGNDLYGLKIMKNEKVYSINSSQLHNC